MRKFIRKTVQQLIKKYNTKNPYELADYLGVEIIERPLGNKLGAYMYIKRTKLILLNSEISDYLKKIVLCHELGHAVLHKNQECYFMKNNTFIVDSKFEYEANYFAANLLISDDLISDYKGYTLEQIANYECVPIDLIKLKFNYK